MGAGWLTYLMINRLKRASGDLADREAQSRHQALHDALSGLPNRHHFVEHLQEQLDALVQTRNNGRVLVAYIDVDRFKDVNDTMGHAAGDTLIMGVAQRLHKSLSREDFLSRFGGDEFAVLRCANGPRAAKKDQKDTTIRFVTALEGRAIGVEVPSNYYPTLKKMLLKK